MNMRVDNVYSAYKLYNTKGKDIQRAAGSSGGQNQDTFTMSIQAEDYRLARQAVSRMPDVRWDRVEAVQSQIASGEYAVSPAMVADKIIKDAYGLN